VKLKEVITKTTGIALSVKDFSDYKYVNFLTPDNGIIEVNCKTNVNLFSYGSLELWEKNEKYYMSGFSPIKSFTNIPKNLVNTSLVFYFNELLLNCFHSEKTTDSIIRLYLISLYYLDTGEKPAEHIRRNFEYRLMCLAGYEPISELVIRNSDFDSEQYVKECLEIYSFKSLDFYKECTQL
jgi:DNA repair protein RecO